MKSARLFICELSSCRRLTIICSGCEHGDIYCSPECAEIAEKESHRLSNARYQKSRKGKFKRSENRRLNQQRKTASVKKRADGGSIEGSKKVKPPKPRKKTRCETPQVANEIHCDFCGDLCCAHLRKGFLKEYTS